VARVIVSAAAPRAIVSTAVLRLNRRLALGNFLSGATHTMATHRSSRHGSVALGLCALIGRQPLVFLLRVFERLFRERHPRLKHARLFEVPSLREPWEGDVAGVVFGQELIDELIHAHHFPPWAYRVQL
jgi:hypothetical protein